MMSRDSYSPDTPIGSTGWLIFTQSAIFTITVKIADGVKLEGTLSGDALRVVRDVLDVSPAHHGEAGHDAVLRFADTTVAVQVMYRKQLNAGSAWQMVHTARESPDVPLLLVIATESTASARQILREHDVSIIDSLGNAHLELPGLLIHREAPPSRQRRKSYATRLSGRAGVAAQALLLDPDHDWGVSSLAKHADISVGLAHRVLARLETEGIVASEGSGPSRIRRVTDRTALLDLWAEEQADRPERIFGYVLTQSPQQLIEHVGTALGQAGVDYALTGAAAASLLAPFATATPVVEVWVPSTVIADDLHDATDAEPVADGPNVVFLRANDDTPLAFRQQRNTLWLTNRFRIYRDLLGDPRRGREQAQHLREETIGW